MYLHLIVEVSCFFLPFSFTLRLFFFFFFSLFILSQSHLCVHLFRFHFFPSSTHCVQYILNRRLHFTLENFCPLLQRFCVLEHVGWSFFFLTIFSRFFFFFFLIRTCFSMLYTYMMHFSLLFIFFFSSLYSTYVCTRSCILEFASSTNSRCVGTRY